MGKLAKCLSKNRSLKEPVPDLSSNIYFKERFQIANEAFFVTLNQDCSTTPNCDTCQPYMSTLHLRTQRVILELLAGS